MYRAFSDDVLPAEIQMDGTIFQMTELSMWALMLLAIFIRDSRVDIWLPGTSSRLVTISLHINSLYGRTVLFQLCRIVLPIGCVHLLRCLQ